MYVNNFKIIINENREYLKTKRQRIMIRAFLITEDIVFLKNINFENFTKF